MEHCLVVTLTYVKGVPLRSMSILTTFKVKMWSVWDVWAHENKQELPSLRTRRGRGASRETEERTAATAKEAHR